MSNCHALHKACGLHPKNPDLSLQTLNLVFSFIWLQTVFCLMHIKYGSYSRIAHDNHAKPMPISHLSANFSSFPGKSRQTPFSSNTLPVSEARGVSHCDWRCSQPPSWGFTSSILSSPCLPPPTQPSSGGSACTFRGARWAP